MPSSGNPSPTAGSQYGFPKSRRLLKRADFQRVYDRGSRIGGAGFVVFWLRRDDDQGPRVGFTTPRALGKAVIRNRIRRRMREAVRLELARLAAPVDLVFHPRHGVLTAEFDHLRRDVTKVFVRCGTS